MHGSKWPINCTRTVQPAKALAPATPGEEHKLAAAVSPLVANAATVGTAGSGDNHAPAEQPKSSRKRLSLRMCHSLDSAQDASSAPQSPLICSTTGAFPDNP